MTKAVEASSIRTNWPARVELVAIVAFWTLLGGLTLVRRLLDPRGPTTITSPDALFVLAEYGIWAVLTPAVFLLARRLPIERGAVGRGVAAHAFIAVLMAAVLEIVRVAVLRPMILPEGFFGPGGSGPPRFTPLEALMRMRFLDELVIYLAVLAAGFARDYFVRYRMHAAEAARLEAQLAEARLSALRMQLNPHFLFNTLHSVSALVERDPAGARRLIARLSALLRHVLDSGARQEVTLADELAFLRDYLDIQQVRFQGRLEIVEDVPEHLQDALVPNLILQPLVENAIVHGVGRTEGYGRIAVTVRGEAERLSLRVHDNGPGLRRNGAGTGVGLSNTVARLAGLYGSRATLSLHERDEGGTEAMIVLPLTFADTRRLPVADLEGADG